MVQSGMNPVVLIISCEDGLDAREIQVERVKFLRYGEARGDYDQVVAALNATDPHGPSSSQS